MIRKLLKNLLILSLCAAAPVIAGEQDESLDAVRERITGIFDVIEPENVNPGPIDGWYEIQKGSVVAYVSADGRYLLQGDLIDLDAGINLSDISRNKARRTLMAELDDSEVIMFAPENPKYSVTVFTDIGCTYCRRLHNQIDEYMAQGIAVRYVLYPRNGPASSEWNTSEQVWCAKDRNSALTAAKLDRKFETSACDASIIQDYYLLGREVGLAGTPAIVLEDGTLISGYVPPVSLAEQLQQNTTEKAASR